MSEPTGEYSLDELAKGLATGTLSRGKAIRWMGGALLGAALASFPGVAWANDCRPLGRECRRDSQCCSRNCIRRGDDKVCGCPEGKRRCNDRCVNLQRSERHCGACFNQCPEGQECVDGECGGGCLPDDASCTADNQCCGGRCVQEAGVGFCEGPNLVFCSCQGGTVGACRSFACGSAALNDFCTTHCASSGGLVGTECTPGGCTG